MTSELPRPVYQPPRPETVRPTEQPTPTIPPSANAKILQHIEHGIVETIEGMTEVGLSNQLGPIEEFLTSLERKCLSNQTNKP